MSKLNKIASSTFSIDTLLPIQRQVIERVQQGEHCLLLMPTGMGKSICYQLPAVMSKGLTIVISPLIALMNDQVADLKEKKVDAAFINSSLSALERRQRYENLANEKYQIIYVAAERFYKEEFLQAISQRSVSLLAIDEAHCISEWGSDFRPAYTQLGDFRKLLKDPPTLALTATATAEVQNDIVLQLGLKGQMKTFHAGIERENLHLSVRQAFSELEKFAEIVKVIADVAEAKIIYFNLIKNLEAFSAFLDERKIPHERYHGKLDKSSRDRSLAKFQRQENILMLATNAFGMGINKANVRLIVHAEICGSVEAYYQEIGRAGRDGKVSNCILFYDQNDLAVQMDFLTAKNPQKKFIEDVYREIKALQEKQEGIEYQDLQEKIVFGGKHDHRLQTVLNLFDRYEVTTGDIERHNLELVGKIEEKYFSVTSLQAKAERDRQRLVKIVEYANLPSCRKQFLVAYFGFSCKPCGVCDNCLL